MDIECDYIPESNEPCESCPRQMTCWYMCKLLQEAIENDEGEDDISD